MKSLRWFILLSCFVASSALMASAQKRKPAVPQVQFSQTVFDLTAKQLPPKYLGHSLVDVWGLLNDRKKKFSQGEYETTQAWQTRLAKLKTERLMGEVTMVSDYAFKLTNVETTYSADAEALTLTAQTAKSGFDSINNDSLLGFDSIQWWYNNKKAGAYVGSNAFGVKRRVQVETEQIYYLLFKPETLGKANTLTIHDVKPETAKVIRPQLRALLIGTPMEPYIGGDKEETDATIDDPVKTLTYSFYLYFKPKAIWFYNTQTGEVYYKADLTPKQQTESKK